jgi:GntR family transcriptional regulator
MYSLKQSNITPLYKQLKAIIKESILNREMEPDQKIPSEIELSNKYKVSRITVRNAISELVEEDLLVKKQGKGTFVTLPKIETGNSSISS